MGMYQHQETDPKMGGVAAIAAKKHSLPRIAHSQEADRLEEQRRAEQRPSSRGGRGWLGVGVAGGLGVGGLGPWGVGVLGVGLVFEGNPIDDCPPILSNKLRPIWRKKLEAGQTTRGGGSAIPKLFISF